MIFAEMGHRVALGEACSFLNARDGLDRREDGIMLLIAREKRGKK